MFWGWTMGDRGRITDAVLQEAARLSFSNSYSTNMAAGSKRAVSGTVMGSPAEGRVLVSLGRGLYATILTTLVTKDVPGDRLFTKGMAVTGLFDEDSRRLDLTAPRPREAREALAGYASGMVVPARVTAARRDSCTLELFPRGRRGGAGRGRRARRRPALGADRGRRGAGRRHRARTTARTRGPTSTRRGTSGCTG